MFREKYKNDNEMINPSDDFLGKLKTEMKKEEKLKITHIVGRNRKILMTASSIAFVFIGITAFSRISSIQKNDIVQKTEINYSEEKSQEQKGLFSNSKWYDSNLSAQEIYDKFIERISSQNDLEKLSTSSSNQFTDNDIMNESEVRDLAELLKGGTLIEDEDYSKENPEYYMADFKNGDVIKFTIYDNKYFECNEFKGHFVISSFNK